jgi:polyisoprenoid-binding protein YceI
MKRHPAALCFLIVSSVGPATGAANRILHPERPISASSAIPKRVELQKKSGCVEFFAVGWPSALKIHGKGSGPEGAIEVVGNQIEGSIEFDLNTLETGIELRDRHMKEQYLHTARFPRAVLKLEHMDAKPLTDSSAGSVSLPFRGVLSLHGVERPVGGEARVSQSGSRVGTVATFEIQLGDFGIEVPKYLGIAVAEKVQVKVAFSALVESAREVVQR